MPLRVLLNHKTRICKVFGSSRSGGGAGALDELIVVANKADLALAGGEGHDKELKSLAAAAAGPAATAAAPPAVPAAVPAALSSRTAEPTGRQDGEKEEEGEEAVAAVLRAAKGRGGELEWGGGRVWKLSCKTKEGLDGFMEHLEAEVRSRFQGAADDESPLITRCVCARVRVCVLFPVLLINTGYDMCQLYSIYALHFFRSPKSKEEPSGDRRPCRALLLIFICLMFVIP